MASEDTATIGYFLVFNLQEPNQPWRAISSQRTPSSSPARSARAPYRGTLATGGSNHPGKMASVLPAAHPGKTSQIDEV